MSGRADFFEHVDDAFVGAAVQRPFERADGGADRRVHVAERRGDDTGGEGRGIEPVLGVQDVGHVERLRGLRARLVPFIK